MKAIIVDDEQPALDMLRLLLEQDGRITVEGAYRKPREALETLRTTRPDIAFLDVDMPQMNGLDMARRIQADLEHVEVVFVTAYSQYALDAFRHNALDYLLKPLTPEAVQEAVNRLYKRRSVSAPQPMVEEPLRRADSARLKVLPFGSLDILDRNAQPIRWRTLKTKELMAYFLAKEGQPVSKWDVLADIWPDLNEEQGRSYLHTTLYKLKKALMESMGNEWIQYISGHYYAEFDSIDNPLRMYRRFEQKRPSLTHHTVKEYQLIVGYYQGELFGRLDYSWSYPYRKKCFELFREACIRLCRYYLEIKDCDAAADMARQLLAQSDIDEEAHELMLQIHYQRNDRMALKAQYELLRSSLHNELGLAPKPEVQKLYSGMLEKLGVEAQ